MDYKDTLNLPRTEFPMKADLVLREPQRLKKWQTANLYQQIQKQRAGATRFVRHDGPPFANGDVHIGTALNKSSRTSSSGTNRCVDLMHPMFQVGLPRVAHRVQGLAGHA